MLRLFVALDLPQEVKAALMTLCHGVAGAKWRRDDQLHLTLRFIGEVDGAMARDIADVLGRIEAPTFQINVRGLGHFGDQKRPRILWAGVDSEPALKRLQGKIVRALQEVGLEDEHRKFHPHITLARLQGARMPDITGFEATCGAYPTLTVPVDNFVLYSSYLSGEGAIYTPEAVYPLGNQPGGDVAWDRAWS